MDVAGRQAQPVATEALREQVERALAPTDSRQVRRADSRIVAFFRERFAPQRRGQQGSVLPVDSVAANGVGLLIGSTVALGMTTSCGVFSHDPIPVSDRVSITRTVNAHNDVETHIAIGEPQGSEDKTVIVTAPPNLPMKFVEVRQVRATADDPRACIYVAVQGEEGNPTFERSVQVEDYNGDVRPTQLPEGQSCVVPDGAEVTTTRLAKPAVRIAADPRGLPSMSLADSECEETRSAVIMVPDGRGGIRPQPVVETETWPCTEVRVGGETIRVDGGHPTAIRAVVTKHVAPPGDTGCADIAVEDSLGARTAVGSFKYRDGGERVVSVNTDPCPPGPAEEPVIVELSR